MSRLSLGTLKTVFASEYWLVVTIGGAFFSFFALNRGGVVVFIEAGFIFFLINLISGNYPVTKIPLSYWIVLGICAYLISASYLFYPQVTHYRWVVSLGRMLCLLFAIHCLSQKGIRDWVTILFGAVLLIAVCWQVAAYNIFHMSYGTFSNPHLISNFTMLAIPPIIYFIWIIPRWYKIVFIAIGILDVDFMLRVGSLPSIVAIITASFLVIFFLMKDRRKWIGVFLICSFFLFLHFSHYADIAAKVENLIINYKQETRLLIWSSTIDILKDNTLHAWIFGNGIGGFRAVYPKYAHTMELSATFPHFFLLEVMYQSGLVGAILVFGGIIMLVIHTIRSLKFISDRKVAFLTKILLVMLLSWLIHCGLTVHFYSKYSQYSLAFILGTLLAVLQNPGCRKKDKPISS